MRARAAEASDRRCRAGGGSGGGRWGLMRVRTNVRANGARTFLYLLSPRWRRQAGARAHSRGTAYMVRAEYKCSAKTHARTPRMRAFYSIPNIDGKHQRKTRPFIHSMCVPAFCVLYMYYMDGGCGGEGVRLKIQMSPHISRRWLNLGSARLLLRRASRTNKP